MEKLVRDKMPDICASYSEVHEPGWTPMNFRIASPAERVGFLIQKLKEETKELYAAMEDDFGTKARMVEEFADVKQCYVDLLAMTTTSDSEVEQVRINKEKHRGGFKRFVIWDGKK